MTRQDIYEILATTGHKAYVRSRKGGRCLTVHDGGHGLPDQLLDQAIEMALQKIQLDAIAKITLDDNGRRPPPRGQRDVQQPPEVVIAPAAPLPFPYFAPTGAVYTPPVAATHPPPYPGTNVWNSWNDWDNYAWNRRNRWPPGGRWTWAAEKDASGDGSEALRRRNSMESLVFLMDFLRNLENSLRIHRKSMNT